MTNGQLIQRASVVLACALLGVLVGVSARAQDVLDAQLRSEVEALKQAAATPTTPENYPKRSAVLWRWANTFALNGGYVPVNLTTVTRIKPPNKPTPAVLLALDDYIAEMTLVDEQPDALGSLTATLGPFEARSRATLQQTYKVGSKAIDVGGGFAVARHFLADYGAFQTSEPGGANFVGISSSNANVHFVVDQVPVAGMHGGFRGAAQVLFFRLSAGRLNPGDEVTITYGGRADGGSGLLMPTFSSDRMPFPLYVDFDGNGPLYSLPIQPVRVVGARIAGVHGFAPSVVRPGETFTLSVRAQDQYYNRATGPIPGWKVLLGNQVIATLPAGDLALQTVEDLSFQDQGVVRLSVESESGDIVGSVNPILVSAEAPRVYWGDTHGHSGFAEGIGTPDRFMTWAKEDARLDFVTHSEHDIWLDDFEWQQLQENVRSYSESGQFIAFLGYEWTTRNLFGGHHNVLFRTAQGRDRIATQFYPTLSQLYQRLRERYASEDVVVIPHAHQTGNYRMSDPQLQPLVEVMSQHGSFEWFGRKYLEHGHQVGFTAASDNHLSQPGYTAPKGRGLSQRGGLGAVMAAELTRDELFDGMRARRTYATTGERIILQTSVNGTDMGSRGRYSANRSVVGKVIATAPIAEIAIVKNGEEVWRKDYVTAQQVQRLGTTETVYLNFASASFPEQPGDNPRGWRPWQGSLKVHGATLEDAQATDFFNADVQQLRRVDDDPSMLYFSTATRGDSSAIALTLTDIRRGARIELQLKEGREFGGGPPIYRPHQQLPGSKVELSVADVRRGNVEVILPFGSYEDRISLRRVGSGGPMEMDFEWEDKSGLRGDNYYVRVTQLDGAMAWSSPIWIGGYAPK